MSYIEKVFLLGAYVFGATLMGMDLHKGNCRAEVMQSAFELAGRRTYIVLFYHKDNSRQYIRSTCWLKDPVESIQWDDQKHGILHIHCERGKNLEFDVNG